MADQKQRIVQELLDRFEPLEYQIQRLCDLADEERHKFHLPAAKLLCDEGFRAAQESGDQRAEGICLMHRWAVHFMDRKLTEAATDCRDGRSRFDNTGDSFSHTNAAIALGLTYEEQGQLYKSLHDRPRSRKAFQNAIHAYRADEVLLIVEENRRRPGKRRLARLDEYEAMLDDLNAGFERATRSLVQTTSTTPARPLGDLDTVMVLAHPIRASQPVPTIEEIEGAARIVGNRAYFSGNDYDVQLLDPNRGNEFVPRPRDYTYFIAPVAGDSMNRTGIEDGDHVLLRRNKAFPGQASTSDIVAAGVDNVDTYSTLKRYFERDGKHLLIPESFNTVHQPLEFSPDDWMAHVRIAGIAVAVLKKVSF